MIFEVGKYYEHTSGIKIACLCEMDTFCYGHGICAENLYGKLIPIGIGSAYTVNWHEISEEEWLNSLKESPTDDEPAKLACIFRRIEETRPDLYKKIRSDLVDAMR